MSREFHDLSEVALNHESGGRTQWGNLGDWQAARTYPQACAALAERVARAARLRAEMRVIDVGFGCGDQLLHWIDRHGVRALSGLNLSHVQTDVARERVAAAGHAGIAAHLTQGSAQQLAAWATHAGHAPADAVLALDCAYHFPSRTEFFAQAAQVLRPGGRLVLSDVIVARADLSLAQRARLYVMARLSRIPRGNLVEAQAYRAQCAAAGFEVEDFEDITGQVFVPFGDWLRRYRAGLDRAVARRVGWTKYEATAAFLRWAQRERVLRYVVCAAVRT